MSDIACPRCGVANPGESAFCRSCGTPFPASGPGPAAAGTAPPGWQRPAGNPGPPPGWQPAAGNAPGPPAGAYPPTPQGAYPPPPSGYPPPPQGYPPPGGYPGSASAGKSMGNNSKIAFGLAAISLVGGFILPLLGYISPFLAGCGAYMAKKEMDDIAAGRAPQLDPGWAKGAYYTNLVLVGLAILGLFLLMSRGCAAI
jgi:hypothetical protein